jgi:aminopeptidase N
VTIDLPADFKWVKLNADQRGYFRVNYLADHWSAIATALRENVTAMSASDRYGVIDDSFSLSAAGSLPYSTSLELVEYVKNDRHPVPWSTASAKLSSISSLIYITNLYPGFRVRTISAFSMHFYVSINFVSCCVLEIHHYSCGAFILRIRMGTIRGIFGSV